jgi:hypothetical protein
MPAASYIKMTALARNFEMEVILIFLKKWNVFNKNYNFDKKLS